MQIHAFTANLQPMDRDIRNNTFIWTYANTCLYNLKVQRMVREMPGWKLGQKLFDDEKLYEVWPRAAE
eukprot:1283514-Amorphochlora_amoeboformis.AAC.1